MKGGQVFGVFDPSTNGLRELVEEVGLGRWKLITADEPPVLGKPVLDAVVVEDG